jgi:regulator of sigma E protease
MTTLLAFLGAIALLVFVHEFGHYIVARWCDVKVLQFSLGFGPVLFERQLGPDKTRWTLCAIPLGGFVKMLDEASLDPAAARTIAAAELPRAFSQKTLWQRSLVVLAGPVANLLFAIGVYTVLNWVGTSEPAAHLGAPTAQSVAADIGIKQGDLVRAIDDSPVRSWNDFRLQLLELAIDKKTVQLQLENLGTTRVVNLSLAAVDATELEKDFVRQMGFELESGGVKLGEIQSGGAGEKAALKTGDQVISVDDKTIRRASELIELIRSNPEKLQRWQINRDGQMQTVEVQPAAVVDSKTNATVGKISAGVSNQTKLVNVQYGPVESLWGGVRQTWDNSLFSLRMLGKMLVGKLSWKNLSGPITIADVAGQTARAGWIPYVNTLALISVSLAVLNLLPIPILDGGHLVYYGLEALRGRPLSKRVMEMTQKLGLAVIGLMMIVAFSNDLIRQFSS